MMFEMIKYLLGEGNYSTLSLQWPAQDAGIESHNGLL